jgi:hypothetical protein
VLDGLSKAFGGETIGVQSGYRSPARNASVGGAKSSYHMKGQAVDIDMSGWSEAKRQEAIEHLTSLGVGGFITYSKHPNMLHIDLRPAPNGVPHFMFDKTAAQMAKAPDWFKDMAAKAKPAGLAAQLPDSMQAPLSLGQSQMRDEAIQQAFASPTRALDVPKAPFSPPNRPQTLNPPSRFPGVAVGQVTRAALPSIPASLNAAPVGKVTRAPLGPVGQFATPARSLAHPVSAPAPSNLAAAPVGQVTKGPALAPATPNAQTLAAQYSQYRPSTVTQMPTVASMPSIPAPTGLPAAKPTAQPLQHPISLPAAPVAPPAAIAPPAAVLAPALAPNATPASMGLQAAPAAPRATATDVYNGLADSALDNTGLNTVGRIGNTTTVTNKYGVTTGMTPYGKQTAVGSLPSVPGSLPGIKGPTATKIGQAVKGAIPGVAGSTIGGLLGGPVGALIGAALAKAVTQPGGILSNQNNFQTDYFGNIVTNKPQGGLGFPGAPSGGYGSGGKMGASFSNNSRSGMQGISPGAADAIGRGQGGLY